MWLNVLLARVAQLFAQAQLRQLKLKSASGDQTYNDLPTYAVTKNFTCLTE